MNLLDLLSELIQLPPERRQARLDELRLSEADRAELEHCLRSNEQLGDFLENPPALVSEAMQLLRGGWTCDRVAGDSRTLSVINVAAPSFGQTDGAASFRPQVPGYEVEALLGQGGMASVWRATQLATRRPVALKVMSQFQGATPRARGRFERELRLTARLQHPHIARVYDAGTSGRLCYFAMELVEGQPLDQFVRSRELTQRQILELMLLVCDAVTHAHQKGVIHRDLKPNNILVDSAGQPRVLDFGLAKALEEAGPEISISLDGELAGTPAYMSPEQAAGSQALDTRTDVYSLGVILYRLLTGHPPHELAGPRLEVLKRISTQDVQRPRELCKQIDAELEAVLLKALDREPDRRYGSAAELGRDLRRYLADEPVEAVLPSRLYRLRKLLRRHKRETTAVAAVGAALVLGMIGTTWGLVRATAERTAAQNESRRAQAVSRFMTGILARARPGAGGNLRVVELLKLASKDIQTALRDQPEAEIEARQTLADTYWALGMFVEAEPEVNRAHALSVELDQGRLTPRTLRLAAKLARIWYHVKPSDDPSTARLARETYESARRMLGETDPITQVSAQALAVVLTLQGQPAEGEQLIRRLLAQAPDQPADTASDPEFHQEMRLSTLVWALHNQDTVNDEIIWLQRALVRRMRADKNSDPLALTDAETVLAAALSDRGLQEESLDILRLNMADCRERLGIVHSYTQWVTSLYAAALARSKQWDAAIDLLNENLRLFRAQQPDESRLLACALVRLGMLQVEGHRREGIAIALEGLAMAQRVGGVSDPSFDRDGALRATLLGGLGSWDYEPDGSLAAQVFSALDEMFLDNQSRLFEFTAARPADVHYHLRRWGDSADRVAEGTLDGLLASRQPESGLYGLTLDVPKSGASPLHQKQWVLFAPWDASFYVRATSDSAA